ncbi:MAG: Hint domain-containing protein [Parasphingorhabdus sp.]|uniref:Hint domain-containing protein n=1 Tax=Parasphingorhabdus sp. TaxID=2709688 RepID=UPI0032980677
MAFISEIYFRGTNNGNGEFVEITLAPGDVPADFVLSAYNQNGNLHIGSGLPGGEISLSSLTGAPHPDNPAYTIYTVPLGIKNANSDNNEASGVALTNVTDGVVIDFYSADNIAAIDPQQGAANLAGVVSDNILEHTLTSNTESFQWDIDGNLTFGTTNSGSSTICFDAAVPMETARGLVPCGDLRPGDAVATLDHGHRRIRWVGHSHCTTRDLQAHSNLRPVLIKKDALGPGMPQQDMRVSRQHRILVRSAVAHRIFGDDEVLIAAHKLTGLPGIKVDDACRTLTYVHILMDRHEILNANGALCESLLLAPHSDQNLQMAFFTDPSGRAFPAKLAGLSRTPARQIALGENGKSLIARLKRNKKSVQAEHGLYV